MNDNQRMAKKTEFEDRVAVLLERVPKSLPIWEELRSVGGRRAIGQVNYDTAASVFVHLAPLDGTLDALGWMVYWIMRYVPTSTGRPIFHDVSSIRSGLDDAWSVAKKHGHIKDLLAAVRCELLQYERQQGGIRLFYNGCHELALLDNWLRKAEGRRDFGTMQDKSALLRERLGETEAAGTWFEVSHRTRQSARAVARSYTEIAPSFLPPETTTAIDGVSLGQFGEYWTELLSMALHDISVVLRGPPHDPYDRGAFCRHMARMAGISEQAAERVTDSLTMSQRYASNAKSAAVHNPQLTPIVEVDGGLMLVSSLIVGLMPSHHNMKLLQVVYQKSFGDMGRLLGDIGESIVGTGLSELLGDDVFVEVDVKTTKVGSRDDDTNLDVVVFSPGQLLIVIEVKWHIPVNSTYESVQKEDDARLGRGKLERLRRRISRGETRIKWPKTWDKVAEDPCEWRWFVLTHDTTPVHNLGPSDITIRSYLLLKHLLKPGASARDLVNLLDDPPTPVAGVPCWKTVKYGDVTIEWENPQLHPDQPEPFKDLELENHQEGS